MAVSSAVIDLIPGLTDGELISIAVGGRVDGFEELVRRYQRPITGYVFRMLGDYESALDVTQEVFIKVYNSLSKYSPEYKFSTWLYRIAHNAAIDHLRRNTISAQSIEPKMPTDRTRSRLKAAGLRPNRTTNTRNGKTRSMRWSDVCPL